MTTTTMKVKSDSSLPTHRQSDSLPTLPRRASHALVLATLSVLLVASPAFAQNLESKVQSLGALVINVLSVVAVVIATAATILCGMKYFGGDPHAREQVKGIAIGAFFAFAAAGIVQAMKTALA